MPSIEIRSFGVGEASVTGWQSEAQANQGADRLINGWVNDYGNMVARKGSTTPLVSAAESSQITAMFRANRLNAASLFQHFFIVEASTTPLKRLNSAAWTEVLNNSVEPPASFAFAAREAMYPGGVVFDGRFFLGLNSATNRNSWIDLNAATPLAYTLGHAVPTTPTDALVAGGSLTSGSWYGYVYTYYNPTYAIETAPSAVTTANPSGANLTVRLTMTQTVDEQFTQVRIYRTSAQTSSALAESATKSLLTTTAMTNGTATFTYDDDGTGTLGAANATDDHDVLTSQWRFVASYQNRLYAVISPRTLVYSKRTTTSMFPDAFPSENSFDVGEIGGEITGLILEPSGSSLLVFTTNAIYRVTEDAIPEVRLMDGSIGCPYPRALTPMPGGIRFLGTDSQIWETDGNALALISKRIDRYLRDKTTGTRNEIVCPALGWIPSSSYFENAFYHSQPSGQGNHIVTSANTTVSTPGGTTLFGGTTKYRIVDGTALSLSQIHPGMWACVRNDPSRNGVVVAATDATDTVDVEDWRGSAPATGERFVFIEQIDTFIHELNSDYWREMVPLGDMRYVTPYVYSAWTGASDNGEFYSASSSAGAGAVYRIEAPTASDDSGTAIVTLWRSNWINRPMGSRLIAIRVFQQSPTEFSLIRVFTDHSTDTVISTASNKTPAKASGYLLEIDLAAALGYAFMVELTGTAIGTVSRIVFDFTF